MHDSTMQAFDSGKVGLVLERLFKAADANDAELLAKLPREGLSALGHKFGDVFYAAVATSC